MRHSSISRRRARTGARPRSALGCPRRLRARGPLDRVHQAGRPAHGHRRRGRRPTRTRSSCRAVFGLTDPIDSMSPVHIPRGFTKAYIAGEVVEDLGARIREAHAALRRSRRPAHRGDRPRRRRRRDRAVERGRRGDARRARRSSCRRAASAGRSTRSCSTPRCSSAMASPVAGAIVNKVDLDAQPGHREDAGAGPGPPRDPAARRAAVPPDPVQPDARDGPRGRPRRDAPPGPGPRPGHRRRGDRRDGARAHARADRSAAASSSCPATART